MLHKIIDSTGQTNLLAFFLANPERNFFIGELKKRLLNRNMERDLAALVHYNFITPFSKRGKKYYRVNKKHLEYSELKQQVAAVGKRYEDELQKQIKKIKGLKLAILSGIFTGEADVESDLLLVGKFSQTQLDKFIEGLQMMMGQEINYAVMTEKEYDYRKNIFDRFIKDILEKEHLVVVDKIK